MEIVRRAYEAYERDGLEGLLSRLHPEIEWTTTGGFLEAATYRGHDGVRRYLGAMIDEFDDLRNEPEEYIEAGKQVVVTSRASGHGKLSGAPVQLTMAAICSFRDGKILRIHNYATRAEALEAAGVSE